MLSVTLKKRLDTLSKPVPTVQSNGKGKGVAAPSHASRLIVRNMPFNATEQDLRAIFLPYGPIYSIHIPIDTKAVVPKDEVKEEDAPESSTSPRKPPQQRTKGFAFVWMLSKKDAERAMEGCNGMTLRAGMAESLVSDKQKKKKQRRLEKKSKEAAAARGWKEGGADAEEDEAEEEGQEDGDGDDEKEKTGAQDEAATRSEERVIAVDWALSKDKWEKEKAKMEEDEDEEMEDAEDGSSPSDEDDDGEQLGVHSGSGSEPEDDDSDQEDDAEKPVKPELPPPAAGTTLFVRNIPFEATEDDLRTL